MMPLPQALSVRLRAQPSAAAWLKVILVAIPVVLLYLSCASPDPAPGAFRYAGHRYYALQAEAWMQGRLDLPLPVPAGMKALKDPYDPAANEAYRMAGENGLHDLSYYQGKVYLYWGPVPALVAFLPWRLLTGHHLDGSWAGCLFAVVSWLACAVLLVRLAGKHWPQVPAPVLMACLGALGVCSWAPMVLRRSAVWEIAILSATCFGSIMLLLLAESLWSRRRARILWLAGASLALGLAVGSRPIWILWSPCLLWPLWALRSELARRDYWQLLVAAVLPVSTVAVGLLVLNQLRFGSPLDFGQHWQLCGLSQVGVSVFGLSQVHYNLWHYLFSVPDLVEYFPFLAEPRRAQPPAGHLGIEGTYGLLVVLAWLWFAAFTVARRGRASMVPPVAWGGVAMLAILTLFSGAAGRYQSELALPLSILAACGALQIEASLGRARWWWRWALFSILTVTTLNVILTSSSYARVMTGPFGGSPRLEAVANRVGSWLGWCPADAIVAVELTVDFSPQPGPQPTGSGALLASGTYPWNNSVGVGYPSENKVLFQAFRSFTIQRAVEVIMDRSVPHRVRIELGALLPPDRHPFWDGVPSFAIRHRRKQVRILCDGVVILQGEIDDFPPGSALPQIGSLRDASGKLTNPFAGRILDVKFIRETVP